MEENLSTQLIKEGIRALEENPITKVIFKIFIMFIALLVMMGSSLSFAYVIYRVLIAFNAPNPLVVTIGFTLIALFVAITPLLYALLKKQKLKKEQNIS